MDNLLTNMHQRRASKNSKSKKKPVKVVYISNPMKVKTSASQFRALVQELTGQDAGLLPDPTKFTEIDNIGSNQTVQDADDRKIVGDDRRHAHEIPIVDSSHEQSEISDFSFEPFDKFFMPQTHQILENFSGLLPTSYCCESSQVDVMRSLDAM